MHVNMVLWLGFYTSILCQHALMNSGRIRHICLGRNLSSVVKHALYLDRGFRGVRAGEEKNACGDAFRFLPYSIFSFAHSTPRS